MAPLRMIFAIIEEPSTVSPTLSLISVKHIFQNNTTKQASSVLEHHKIMFTSPPSSINFSLFPFLKPFSTVSQQFFYKSEICLEDLEK